MIVSFFLLPCLVGAAAGTDVTGTWEYRGPSESGLWLMTLQTGNVVRFQLEISRGHPLTIQVG